MITVDVETLAVEVATRRYERLGERTWRTTDGAGEEREFDVDEFGLVIDDPQRFRRRR